MKIKILILLVSIPAFSVLAQTWDYRLGGDVFDGEYKTCYIRGTGNEFPYNEPLLAINKYSQAEEINFYIADAGYFQEGTGIKIRWVFNNEPSKIYSTYSHTISRDGKNLFLNVFADPDNYDKLSKIEFIDKLRKASKVTVRISDRYGENTLSFSLSGSSKAINFVIPNLSDLIAVKDAEKIKEAEKQNKINELLKTISSVQLTEVSLAGLESELKQILSNSLFSGDDQEVNFVSLKVRPHQKESLFINSGYVNVYCITEKGFEMSLSGSYAIKVNSPFYAKIGEEKKQIRNAEAQKIKQEKERVHKILNKYSHQPLRLRIKEKIDQDVKSNSFEYSDISNVEVKLSDKVSGKFRNVEIVITMASGSSWDTFTSIDDLRISKKQLKSFGGIEDSFF